MTLLSMAVLFGLIGLAIDGGRGYGVDARLSAAVDAAAIAAARALAEGATQEDRVANAQATAQRYFTLNYPDPYLWSTPGTPATEAILEDGRWRVTVTGTADMPHSFLAAFGRLVGRPVADFRMTAVGQTVRRDLDVMLVMDTSGSLAPPTSPSSVFPALQAAAKDGFVAKFVDGDGGDRVGLVSFASGSVVDEPIDKTAIRGFDRAAVNGAIDALSAEGATAAAEGMRDALGELNAIPEAVRSSLRVILLFSDGAPNVVNGSFPRSSGSPNPVSGNLYSETSSAGSTCGTSTALRQRAWRVFPEDERSGSQVLAGNAGCTINGLPSTGSGGIPMQSGTTPAQRTLTTGGGGYLNTRCNVNRAARNMVETLAFNARSQGIVVFAIGLGAELQGIEMGGCGYGTRETGEAVLKRIANTADATDRVAAQPTGQYCFAEDETQLNACFSRIASEILRLVL